MQNFYVNLFLNNGDNISNQDKRSLQQDNPGG